MKRSGKTLLIILICSAVAVVGAVTIFILGLALRWHFLVTVVLPILILCLIPFIIMDLGGKYCSKCGTRLEKVNFDTVYYDQYSPNNQHAQMRIKYKHVCPICSKERVE